MNNSTPQKSTFVSVAEQVALLNKNAVEIITRLNDVVTSTQSAVEVNLTSEDGSTSTYVLPTVGKLSSDIEALNNSMRRITDLQQKEAYIVDGNATRKLVQVDLNQEPRKLGRPNQVASFGSSRNWFFEGLSDPLLTVKLDLTGKVDSTTDQILSRRYIIRFTKDSAGALTADGITARDEFRSLFIGRNDISLSSFLEWYTKPTLTGVVDNTNPFYDEQEFEFEYIRPPYYGEFSVLKFETDTINNRLWYHLNTLTYFALDGSTRTLAVGDEMIINSTNSTTRYAIREVSTAHSNFRVTLERIEGMDPVPSGLNVLKFYSSVQGTREVRVSVGFDEYTVVFVKGVYTKNHTVGSLWSDGTSFYTNDLVLETDSAVSMSQYYLDFVYDYGKALRDLVQKQIPSVDALTPNPVTLSADNFKVVQINKHLTDTEDALAMRDLHGQKNSIKAKLDQLNVSITQKNKDLSRTKFKSAAERDQSQNELNKLVGQQENQTKLLSSVTKQIVSGTSKPTAEPKYRVRGFWDIPAARQETGKRAQEVVQFEVQYRYSAKNGKDNQTEGYSLSDVTAGTESRRTGYYSNWVPLKTDVRKRSYNDSTGDWVWQVEDVSDADTPNINQLDIPIQAGEKVDVQIRSISEVGWPNAIVTSDWSEIMSISFPDDLTTISGEDEFIAKDAARDDQTLQFEESLQSKGVTQHVSEQFYVNERFYAHKDPSIQTHFTDSNGNSYSLGEYLDVLTKRINSLEEIVRRAKGELTVTVFNNTTAYLVGDKALLNLSVECEDYATRTDSSSAQRTYYNNVYVIKDFYVEIKNSATENPLGLFSDALFATTGTTWRQRTDTAVAATDDRDMILVQEDHQFVWFADTSNDVPVCYGTSVDQSGLDSDLLVASVSTGQSLGISPSYNNSSVVLSNVASSGAWTGGTGVFATTVHPNVVPTDLTEIGTSYIKTIPATSGFALPINIYFRMDNSSSTAVTFAVNQTSTAVHEKRVRVYIQPENSTRPFEFTVSFSLRRNRVAMFGTSRTATYTV